MGGLEAGLRVGFLSLSVWPGAGVGRSFSDERGVGYRWTWAGSRSTASLWEAVGGGLPSLISFLIFTRGTIPSPTSRCWHGDEMK